MYRDEDPSRIKLHAYHLSVFKISIINCYKNIFKHWYVFLVFWLKYKVYCKILFLWNKDILTKQFFISFFRVRRMMTNVFRINELSITIYMIMLVESEKVVSCPLSLYLPRIHHVWQVASVCGIEKKKWKGKARLLYRSLLSLACSNFPILPSSFALFASVRNTWRCLLISQANPASNFGGPTSGPSLSCPRMIGDFYQKSNKSCPSLTVKRISGPSKEINL